MISIRPAYRPGKVPPAPPAVIAPVALFTAVLIAVFGAAYQLESGSVANAPRMQTPTLVTPEHAAHVRTPAPTRTAPPAHPEQRTSPGAPHASV